MQFTTALLAASVAVAVSAAPTALENNYFGVIAIRSGSPIQNAAFQASLNRLIVGAKSQNATCDSFPASNSATFYIKDGELNLFSTDAPYQKVFVDRSGMGQGIIGYVTGAQPLVRNGETKGWAVKDNALTFDGAGIQACPGGIDGSYGLWLAGVSRPGGSTEDCLGINTLVVNTETPDSCTYSQYQG
ncbi:hypothetical protein BCR34DRAFT_602240 [Clohesyomyces aquaticus]|uniref:Cell wall protein PhiA n=1 Tax=Clohesyomyces aquaticus TaxID=1231657 RepID=A0A1Y1ZJ42_9PLEO|nr:hypothetical protein BCR34DRAFT_602240 [Clohesyomyces aquaticus]